MDLFRRFRRKPKVHVLLRFEEGGTQLVGPMDYFSAEIYLAHRITPHPFYGSRRVASARIVVS